MAFDTDVIDDSVEHDAPQAENEAVEEDAQAEPETEQAQDDSDNDGNEQSEGEPSNDEPTPDKKPSRASERIQQLVDERNAAKAELEQLRQQSQQPKPREQSADGAPVKPNIDDFDLETGLDDYFAAQAEYEEKHQDWKLDQRLKQREQSQKQQAQDAEIQDNFKTRFDTNPKFKDDFQQLAVMMQDKPVTADPMQLYGIDDALDIVQEIAANPDLYYEIADMTEQRQYAEFGKLHAQIQSRKSAPKAARQSKAPPPPNHTKANAPIKRDIYSGSDDEFMESRGL